ncbi:MAG TPA: thiol:disulfide interchange protein DsbA/DsbL [Xanthomonadaceae bacterium]
MPSKRTVLRPVLLASALLLLAACNSNNPETPAPEASPPAAASPASAPAPSASNGNAASPAASPATSPAEAASAASSASAAATNAPPPPAGMPPGPTPVEGTDYTVIDTPDQPSGDKVQVTEVFGYGCPHCNALQPSLSAWEGKLPSDVQFTYLPAAFGPGAPHCWDEFTRAFYAAQAMGISTAKSHVGVYKAVWDQHRFNDCTDIPKIYADFGADPKVFASTMLSFAINAKISNAHEQAVHWGVDSTPTIVVDGKYRVQELVNSGPQGMLHTVDWLIAKQRPLHAKH